MFNIGGGEFLAIAVIALIVLGPQRLPDAARQVGKAIGELRRLSSGFQDEIRTAFDENEAAGRSGPRRHVLADRSDGGSPLEPGDAAAADAIAAVSRPPQRPPRRTPLVAAGRDDAAPAGEGAAPAQPKGTRPLTATDAPSPPDRPAATPTPRSATRTRRR